MAQRFILAAVSLSLVIGTSLPGAAVDTVVSKVTDKQVEKTADKDTVTLVQTMHGYVSKDAQPDEISTCIDEVLLAAISQSMQARNADQAIHKYRKTVHRAAKVSKDMLNYMFCDRGFGPSIEGGKLMLDEKISIHGRSSAEFTRQHWLDEMHDKVVTDIVEVVTSLGLTDPARQQELLQGARNSMTEYAGQGITDGIIKRLTAWASAQTADSSAANNQNSVWSMKERQTKINLITKVVAKSDPVVAEVTKKVHKYSEHKKITTVSSEVIETALNTVSLAPTFAGPAAQVALLAFFTFTGGPEEDKLLSEMYMGRRLQSRQTSLANQAALAINAYQLAIETHNTPLMNCSQNLIRHLGGTDLWAQVFSQTQTQAQAPNPALGQADAPAQTPKPTQQSAQSKQLSASPALSQ